MNLTELYEKRIFVDVNSNAKLIDLLSELSFIAKSKYGLDADELVNFIFSEVHRSDCNSFKNHAEVFRFLTKEEPLDAWSTPYSQDSAGGRAILTAIEACGTMLLPNFDLDLISPMLCLAERNLGVVDGLFWAELEGREDRKSMAIMGAYHRHKDNHANRAHVFAWCNKNMHLYASMDKAAAAVYEAKEVLAEFRTIRKWMTDWKREGTPTLT